MAEIANESEIVNEVYGSVLQNVYKQVRFLSRVIFEEVRVAQEKTGRHLAVLLAFDSFSQMER
eukprot:8572456-Prorocentrum_lima.AAC.1